MCEVDRDDEMEVCGARGVSEGDGRSDGGVCVRMMGVMVEWRMERCGDKCVG